MTTPLHPQSGTIEITQEKFSPALKNYIAMLAQEHPFVHDLKIDKRQTIMRLAEFWPIEPAWLAEAKELWAYINTVVQAVPAIVPTHDVLLRVCVANTKLTPTRLPECHEAASIATLCAVSGLMHSCTLQAMDVPPPLDALTISSGVMVVCQPVGHLHDPYIDYRNELSIEASDALFNEREQDKLVKGEKIVFERAPKARPIPEDILKEKHQKHEQEWEMLLAKQEREKQEFERAEAPLGEHLTPALKPTAAILAADVVPNATEQEFSKLKLHHHVYRFFEKIQRSPTQTNTIETPQPQRQPSRLSRFLNTLRPENKPEE